MSGRNISCGCSSGDKARRLTATQCDEDRCHNNNNNNTNNNVENLVKRPAVEREERIRSPMLER